MTDFETAPENFESDIDTTSAEVPDDPVIVDVEGHGKASAYILSEQDMEDLGDEYGSGDSGDLEDVGPEIIAAALREHYVSPSFDGLTAEDVMKSPAGFYGPYLEAIAPALLGNGAGPGN